MKCCETSRNVVVVHSLGLMSSNHHENHPPNNRLRRWNVTFGNPALGTYGGSIVTVHSRKIELSAANGDDEFYGPDEDETSTDSFSSCSSLDTLQWNDKFSHQQQQEQQQKSSVALAANKPSSRKAVMTNVPPHQVPDGKNICGIIALLEFYDQNSKNHPLT